MTKSSVRLCLIDMWVLASLFGVFVVGARGGGLQKKVPAARENLEPENIGAMIVD